MPAAYDLHIKWMSAPLVRLFGGVGLLFRQWRRHCSLSLVRVCYRMAFGLPLVVQRLILQEADVDTVCFMHRCLSKNAVCVDVGAYAGVLLEQMLRVAPGATHWAFEPLPQHARHLQHHFGSRAQVLSLPLADNEGPAVFYQYPLRPAVSGLFRRDEWGGSVPDCLHVVTTTLDAVIPAGRRVDFIKIDAEGSELEILMGARRILQEQQPYLAIECTVGSGQREQERAARLFDLLAFYDYSLIPPGKYLAGGKAVGRDTFLAGLADGKTFFYLAIPAAQWPQRGASIIS